LDFAPVFLNFWRNFWFEIIQIGSVVLSRDFRELKNKTGEGKEKGKSNFELASHKSHSYS
jgi:hypothetical protein